jgi:hypothetical protein
MGYYPNERKAAEVACMTDDQLLADVRSCISEWMYAACVEGSFDRRYNEPCACEGFTFEEIKRNVCGYFKCTGGRITDTVLRSALYQSEMASAVGSDDEPCLTKKTIRGVELWCACEGLDDQVADEPRVGQRLALVSVFDTDEQGCIDRVYTEEQIDNMSHEQFIRRVQTSIVTWMRQSGEKADGWTYDEIKAHVCECFPSAVNHTTTRFVRYVLHGATQVGDIDTVALNKFYRNGVGFWVPRPGPRRGRPVCTLPSPSVEPVESNTDDGSSGWPSPVPLVPCSRAPSPTPLVLVYDEVPAALLGFAAPVVPSITTTTTTTPAGDEQQQPCSTQPIDECKEVVESIRPLQMDRRMCAAARFVASPATDAMKDFWYIDPKGEVMGLVCPFCRDNVVGQMCSTPMRLATPVELDNHANHRGGLQCSSTFNTELTTYRPVDSRFAIMLGSEVDGVRPFYKAQPVRGAPASTAAAPALVQFIVPTQASFDIRVMLDGRDSSNDSSTYFRVNSARVGAHDIGIDPTYYHGFGHAPVMMTRYKKHERADGSPSLWFTATSSADSAQFVTMQLQRFWRRMRIPGVDVSDGPRVRCDGYDGNGECPFVFVPMPNGVIDVSFQIVCTQKPADRDADNRRITLRRLGYDDAMSRLVASMGVFTQLSRMSPFVEKFMPEQWKRHFRLTLSVAQHMEALRNADTLFLCDLFKVDNDAWSVNDMCAAERDVAVIEAIQQTQPLHRRVIDELFRSLDVREPDEEEDLEQSVHGSELSEDNA